MLAYEQESRLLKTGHGKKAHNAGHQVFHIMKKEQKKSEAQREPKIKTMPIQLESTLERMTCPK